MRSFRQSAPGANGHVVLLCISSTLDHVFTLLISGSQIVTREQKMARDFLKWPDNIFVMEIFWKLQSINICCRDLLLNKVGVINYLLTSKWSIHFQQIATFTHKQFAFKKYFSVDLVAFQFP